MAENETALMEMRDASPAAPERPARTIAVMQPYFFPYAAYFSLLAQVDEFVIFDCVQFRRRGRIHRTEVPDATGHLQWLTLPIAYSPRETAIRDIAFADGARRVLDERLSHFAWLSKARGEGADAVREYLNQPIGDFCDFLEDGLRLVARLLGIRTRISRSSELHLAPELRGQERVMAAAKALGATRYLNLAGGKELYDNEAFAREGMELLFLPAYSGPYMSMLHALMTGDLADIRRDVHAQQPVPAARPQQAQSATAAAVRTRTLAIMQPYLFPYVGYYQLAFAADIFVVLEDVTYIKQGWINRNRVLLGGQPAWLTLPVRGASSNVAIRDIRVDERQYPFWRRKMLRSLEQEYGRAPLFEPVRALVERVFPPALQRGTSVVQVATRSLTEVMAYLGLELDVRFASDVPRSSLSRGAQRVLAICKHFNVRTYLNSSGGRELYDRSRFEGEGIELGFVVPDEEALGIARAPDGTQLSLLHGLMHHEPAQMRAMLRCYRVR